MALNQFSAPMPQDTNPADPTPQRMAMRAKLDRALALTDAAGISRGHSMPPAFRLMAKWGLPVRPLHYRSTLWLLVFHFALMVVFFSLLLGAFLLELVPTPNFWPLKALVAGGWLRIVQIATFVAVVTTLSVRRQTKRANLPQWSDV